MTGARSSLMALVLDRPVEDVAQVVADARAAGGIDRASPHLSDGATAQDVHWGGRMQRAVVRATDDEGTPLLRTEVAISSDGLVDGLSRQAALLAALARVLPGQVRGVRDLSARTDRDATWMTRVAAGVVDAGDGVVTTVGADAGGTGAGGTGTGGADAEHRAGWVLTHGAARFGVPDLELYGVPPGASGSAVAVLERVAAQLVEGGLSAPLTLADGTPLRLVPVLEVWPAMPASWPGLGRAGVDRGPGLDGPRATLSVLHTPRFGRHRLDLDGVRDRLAPHQ